MLKKHSLKSIGLLRVGIFGLLIAAGVVAAVGTLFSGTDVVSSKEIAGTQSKAVANPTPVPCLDRRDAASFGAGCWDGPFDAPLAAVHEMTLPTGKVLMLPSNPNEYTNTDAFVYDPAAQTFSSVYYSSPEDGNLFCSGHNFLQDGRILVTGGHGGVNSGINEATLFDYRSPTPWSRPSEGVMNDGRWYPSNCALGNGEQLIMMGNNPFGGYNLDIEIWRNRNKVQLLPNQWPSDIIWNYPFSFLNDKGLVFIAGPIDKSYFIDPRDGSSFNIAPQNCDTRPGACNAVPVRDYGSPVMYSEGKILVTGGGKNPDEGFVPYNSAQTIDISGVNAGCGSDLPTWTTVDPMNFKRRHHNATVLPDGKVLVTGGTDGEGHSDSRAPVFATEIWDPAAAPAPRRACGGAAAAQTSAPAAGPQWKLLAPLTKPRLYHSTAVLLPDARVLVGGGDWITSDAYAEAECPAGHREGADLQDCLDGDGGTPNNHYINTRQSNIEIFSPPYLFNPDGTPATRPQITSSPQNEGYKKSFFVGVDDPAGISKVTLIRLSADTHSFNQGQRLNELHFEPAAGGLNLTTPKDGNSCPPGYYWLFVVNRSGVPSVAKAIQITDKEASNRFDYDADHVADFTVFRASTSGPAPTPNAGNWYTTRSGDNSSSVYTFGYDTDQPVPGDYDGDGITDYAIRRRSTNVWSIMDSSDGSDRQIQFGLSSDIAVPADYDGDRLTDIAIWRPSTGEWTIQMSSTGEIRSFYPGTLAGDLPVPGYYDDDGKADIAFFRPSDGNWYILSSTTNQLTSMHWGANGDWVVPADYDGDGKTDEAIFRPSNGQWWIWNSSSNTYSVYSWGLSTDIPVANDYDGDGKADVGIWRPSTGEWAILRSSSPTAIYASWGLGSLGDVPIPSVYFRH